jgi:hypothetical protein
MSFLNMSVTLDDNRRGYRKLVKMLLRDGDEVEVRGLKTRELLGLTVFFPNPRGPLLPIGVGRKVNTALAAVETLSMLGGVSRPDLVTKAAPTYRDVLVNPDDLDYGAYGLRVETQFVEVARQLATTRDPMSRRAVMTIWRPEDLTHDGDRPCTLSVQFIRRSNRFDARSPDELHMIVTMRSQDVWFGAAYDMFLFGQLRDTLARIVDCTPGWYAHQVGSFHLYERDYEKAEKLVSAGNHEFIRHHGQLPRGITIGDLPREHLSPVGAQRVARALLGETHKTWVTRALAASRNPWYQQALAKILPVEVGIA